MDRRQFIKAAAATVVSMVIPAALDRPVVFPHVMKAERATGHAVWYDIRAEHRKQLGAWFAEEMDKKVFELLTEEVL